MKIQGRGYESVVDCVSLFFENILKSIQQYQQYSTIAVQYLTILEYGQKYL